MIKPIFFTLLVALANIFYNASLPLHFDEAYYWLWAQPLHQSLSYFDHPPMIAWLIALTGFFGESEWIIRLVPVVCMSILGLLIWQLAFLAFDSRTANLAFTLYMFVPITNIGFFMATPDAPLNMFWAAALYTAYKALFGTRAVSGRWLVATGCFFSLALLSKYTAVLLLPALFCTGVFSYNGRQRYFSKAMIVAAVVAVIIFLPVLIWNYQHEWVSFIFQFRHGMAEENVFHSEYLIDFVASQAGTVSFFVFCGLIYALLRFLSDNLVNEKLAFFFWPCILPLAFFAYASMYKRSAANWPVPAYISGLILLSYWASRQSWRKWRIAAFSLAALSVIFLRFPGFFPFLPTKLVFINKLHGAPEVFAQVKKINEPLYILTDGYANASIAAYYIPDRPTVNTFNATRVSMFDYWQKSNKDALPDKALYIGERDEGENLRRAFRRVEERPSLEYQGRRFFVYMAEGKL